MRRTDRRRFPLMAAGALFLYLLADADGVRRAALEALRLCAVSVIPALFPFLVVTGLLIALGFGEWAGQFFTGLMALYRLPGEAGSALALGLTGGYPVGAKAAADLYRRGVLTRDEAERLLCFCNNANPAFLISVLGSGVFGSTRTGLWLFLVHLLSALLTGLLFRGRGGARREKPKEPEPPAAFFPAFVEAAGGAVTAVLRVCGFVVFFAVLSGPLRRGRYALLAGLLELFSLTPLLTADRFGFIAASALAGFGGLGVLCQTAAVLEGSGLSAGRCAVGKAVQGVLAGVLAAAVSVLLW